GGSAPHRGMPPGHLPVRSYLAVPVISRSGTVLGGLFFGHSQPGLFEEEHEALLGGIAGQAATAIDNARLFQAAQKEIAERTRAEA
ncbi:GAF domain-containing protein, partial [Escherichia coli]